MNANVSGDQEIQISHPATYSDMLTLLLELNQWMPSTFLRLVLVFRRCQIEKTTVFNFWLAQSGIEALQ